MGLAGRTLALAVSIAALAPFAYAQAQPQAARASAPPAATAATATGVTPPADYVIGPDDQLSILFWREKDMSADVVVRPDGKITLPLLNEVQAAGLTPEQLRVKLTDEAKQYVQDPNASVVVKEINSRKVFITGEVTKPGPYALTGPMTVLQLISTAGGLTEYANAKKIIIMRVENGRQVGYPFNYKDVLNRKNMKQNIELKPGDTVVVP